MSSCDLLWTVGEALFMQGGRALSEFARRNKYAGEVIGIVSVVACGPASGACVAAANAAAGASVAYANDASLLNVAKIRVKSAALAYSNQWVAGKIAATRQPGILGEVSAAGLRGARGAAFAAASGGDARSGFTGGVADSALGGAIRHLIPNDVGGTLIAALTSGTVSELTGGKFAVGALQGAVGYRFNQVGKSTNSQGSPLSVAGKLWNLPAIGFAYGGLGHIIGEIGQPLGLWGAEPTISLGNNTIEFTGNPFAAGGAITIGNTITWGVADNSAIYRAFSSHERRHTVQGQFMGPAYLPVHIAAMSASLLSSPFSSMRRTVPGAGLAHGKLNFMEGPILKDELY